jgi:rubrerythrin
MDNLSVTAAAIITFSEELEDKSSAFYDALAERWPEQAEMFHAFAKEGDKYKTWIVRTYQETISDALEASYSFEGLNLADYAVVTDLPEGATLAEAVRMAQGLEETACAFYREVAERSESLLATIPMAFKRVARKRERRQKKLAALVG